MPDTPEHRANMYAVATELRRQGLPQWSATISLGDVWDNPDMSFAEQRDAIVARIRASSWYKARIQAAGSSPDRLERLTEEMGAARGPQDFAGPMDAVYDLADADRIWLDTTSRTP